jgi:hypothetical protein
MFHCNADAPRRNRLRRHIATFADQIYALQAFAVAKTSGIPLPSEMDPLLLARSILGLQGPRGQWWWHFDVSLGHAVAHYPVFAVHQLSMAPMALRSAAVAFGLNCPDAIRNSASWCDENEMGEPMYDERCGTVWRSAEIAASPWQQKLHRISSLWAQQSGRAVPPAESLHLNRETRPYEWGWWLYADAIQGSSPAGGHIL